MLFLATVIRRSKKGTCGRRSLQSRHGRQSTRVLPRLAERYRTDLESLRDISVVSDEGQVTVNERFALFFPEKRPFFLEGIELFGTPQTLVYTRRIVDPKAGVKLTGKFGQLGVAHLTAVDDGGDEVGDGGGELTGGGGAGTAVLVLIGCGDCGVDDGSSASASVATISATNAAAARSNFRPRLMGLRRADGTK